MELHPILEADCSAPAPGLWHVLSAVGDVPSMRVGHTATHIRHPGDQGRGHVYFIGGADPDSAHGDVHVLDLDRMAWDRVDEPEQQPPSAAAGGDRSAPASAAAKEAMRPRYEHIAFVPASTPTEIVVIGGADKTGNLEDDTLGGGLSVQAFDTLTGAWRSVRPAPGSAPPPSARTHHASAAAGDCCFLFSGGHSGAEAVGDRRLHRFDAVARVWCAPDVRGESPSPRHGHAMAVAADGVLYVHGGMAGPKLYDDLHALDVGTTAAATVAPSWRRLASGSGGRRRARRPPARAAHAAVAVGRRLFVFGGMGAGGAALDDLWQYDVGSGTWSEVAVSAPPPAPRLDFAACLVPWFAPVGVAVVTVSGRANSASSAADTGEGGSEAADATAAAAAAAAAAAVSALTLRDDKGAAAVCCEGVHADSTANDEPKLSCLLLLVNGGMDTQGEIFDDTLIFKLPS